MARRRAADCPSGQHPAAGSRHVGAAVQGCAADANRAHHRTRRRDRHRSAGQAGARLCLGGRTPRRARRADRRLGDLRLHRAAGGPLHPHGFEDRIHLALVRTAPAAAGGHAAAARRRPAAEGRGLQPAARRRHCRPRAQRRRRGDARRDRPRHALPVSAGRSSSHAGWHGADRRPGPVPRVGTDARRLLRQRAHAPARTWRRRRWRAGWPRRRARRWRSGRAWRHRGSGGGDRGRQRRGAVCRRRSGSHQLRAHVLSRRDGSQRSAARHGRRQPASARHQLQPAARAHVAGERTRHESRRHADDALAT